MNDRTKLTALIRFRDSIMNLINVSGGATFLHYRRAAEELLTIVLGRNPTDDELDSILCDRER
jgi:hypothetical protein